MRKSFITLFLSIFFVELVLAQLQSHPLSEITPIDVNLDMYGFNITNVSYVGIGVTLPSYSLHVAGQGYISNDLIIGGNLYLGLGGPYFYSSGGTIFTSSDLALGGNLNLQNNNITNVNYLFANVLYATNFYQNGNKVLDVTTNFGGDVSGTYDNLQLGVGVVSSTEIADNSIQAIDLVSDLGLGWKNLTGYPSSCQCEPGQAIQVIGDECVCVDITTQNVSGSGASGQVAFWLDSSTLSGDDNLYWDNTNKRLGIGTNNPQTFLDIQASTSPLNGIIRIKSTSTDSVARIVLENDEGKWALDVDGALSNSLKVRDLVANKDRFVIDPWGRIGINTTSPLATLHIIGSFRAESGGGLLRFDPSGNTWVGI